MFYLAMLMLMASPGHGQSAPAERQDSLPDITSTSTLAILANHIPNRYILSFRHSANVPGFHAIKVQVLDQPGTTLNVATRTSCWVGGTVPRP
jgi:hypothetical protein